VELVEATYRVHGAGDSVNPPSYFLRFPDRPSSRIIALPASIGGQVRVDGLKWISSFPDNVAAGIPRASAVLILNDHDTGYPFACLESSIISATRTAASAALAADWLSRGRAAAAPGRVLRHRPDRPLHPHLPGRHRLDVRRDRRARPVTPTARPGSAPTWSRHLTGPVTGRSPCTTSAEELIRSSDLVVFATIAGEPHVTTRRGSSTTRWCCTCRCATSRRRSCSTSTNIVDDVEHCLKANTSPHLAEQLTGNRDFLAGTLDDVMAGRVTVPADRPVVFSPFGLGVLDLAVGKYVYDEVLPAPASCTSSTTSSTSCAGG
jgi:ornithine cyclodeaminase/alanine dehydrogenase-like protein (mu-crystallin family)